MAALEDVDIAVNNQITRGLTLQDTTDTEHTFVAMLKGMDTFYGTKNRRFTDVPLKGRKAQANFRMSLPQGRGIAAMTPTMESTRLPMTRNMSIKAGEMGYSAYIIGEAVPKFLMNRLESDEAIADYAMEVGDAVTTAVYKDLSDFLFPGNTMAPTLAGGASGSNADDKPLSVGYPLQSGYADNAASGSGSYMYLGIDLNATGYTGIKSVQAGTQSSAFGQPTYQNIRRGLLMPLRKRGARPDLLIGDYKTYDFWADLVEDKYQTTPQKTATGGATFVKILDTFCMYEPELDDLDAASLKREVYALDTRTWVFGMDGAGGSWDWFNKVVFYPAQAFVQGYIEWMLMCKNPRLNGRAYNVTD